MGYGPVDYQAWILDFGFVERPGKNISSFIGGKNAVPAVLAPAADKVSDHCPSVGGGFYENIPRSIPDGLGASIEKAAVKVLPIFSLIAKAGNVPEHDMFNTFNMGVGMSVIVAAEDAEKAVQVLKDAGEEPYIIGKIVRSDDKVTIW